MPTNGLVKPEELGVSKKPFVMVGRQLDMDKILIYLEIGTLNEPA